MLLIFLKILKIIGIFLLSVLILALTLILMVLLLPVRYRLSLVKNEGSKLKASFKLTYFFHIFRVYADYCSEVNVKVKVFWFTLFKFRYPDPGKESDGEDEDLKKLYEEIENELDDEPEALDSDQNTGDTAETESTDAEEGTETVENVPEDETDEEEPESDNNFSENEDSDNNETAENDEYSDEKEDEDSLYGKLKYKVDQICDKIDKCKSEYRYYRNVINSNEAAYALRNLKKRLFKILRSVFPRKVHADLVFGFDSPDITGKVYGIYCIFRKRFDKKSVVIPDFDRQVFEGTIYAKGHFNLFSIAFNALCFILSRSSLKIYRSVKHHKKKNETNYDGEEKTAA